MPTIAVFAGSKTPTDPAIIGAATLLGQKLAAAGYDITYGGGDQGVMGAVAKAALQAGGKVTAIVLEQYMHEIQLPGAETIFAKTEQDRFRLLTTHQAPVAFFALPGSAGTMREVLQALELTVYENGPEVILVKVGQYLDGLKDVFDHSVAAGMTRADKADKLKFWPATDALEGVLPSAIAATPSPKAAASPKNP